MILACSTFADDDPATAEPTSDTLACVPRPRTYKTRAIVLAHFDLGEADRIITLLTPVDGKIRAVAKGVRRPRSRIGGSVEPFAELEVVLARGRNLDVITQVSVAHAWLRLRDRLESTATAWYLGELADRAVEERAGAHPVYGLLRRACQLLDDGMAPGRVARWFESGLADALGVRPELDRCVECARTLEESDRFRWVPALGGVLCGAHPPPPAESIHLGVDALKLLRAYRRLDVEALAALRLPAQVEAEVESAMRRYTRHVLEREARSLDFVDEVRRRPRAGG
jgi:DNA repair protein RecO (recombination protein O)